MQFLITRLAHSTIRTEGLSDDTIAVLRFDDVENRVVEAETIADAIARGMLGQVVDGGESKKLTRYKLLNVIPLDGCSREDAMKINELGTGSGLTQEDCDSLRDIWEGE